MYEIKFSPAADFRHHACHAVRQDEWIIYRCSKCGDYERRYNWQTGEMQTVGQRPHISHFGIYNGDGKTSRQDLN